MPTSPIFVTQPSLPPLDELLPYLEKIWNNKILTNCGPLHKELEAALCEYLGVPYISLFTNATIALITSIKALNIQGEVITTPYSFVATSHSLLWNGLKPVFVDIEPKSLNLDPTKIEAAITSRTTAILPVHVYGHPCDVDAIDAIAKRHGLKVIYDAAHAFGVQCHCGSILNHGDLSILSFHATKVFNTFEGGAIVCKDADTKLYIDQLKNFGFVNETSVVQTGINGKMSEFNAALGLLQLKHIDAAIAQRQVIDSAYRAALNNIPGIRLHIRQDSGRCNYGYFPIFVENDYPLKRDQLYEELKINGINSRRYFYPLISDFPMYHDFRNTNQDKLMQATQASNSVLCLPMYSNLEVAEIHRIASIIRRHMIP